MSQRSQRITLKSQAGFKLSETLVFAGVLAAVTIVVAFFYGRRISEAHAKYVEAKEAVSDIVLSFNRQVRSQEEHLEATAREVNVLQGRDELLSERLEEQKRVVSMLGEKVNSISGQENMVRRLDSLEARVNEFVSMRESLEQRVGEIEKRRLRQREPEMKIESAIPIKREKALASLTETELAVLDFIASEGEKTAPEIKERIKLSREHTARLMKKLYEEGYLERSANRVPFKYRLKEEMQKFLKKPEQKS
jgi:predicted transcriptional regulator